MIERILLVEDNTEAVPLLQRALVRAAPGASVTWCHHNQVVDDPSVARSGWDVVLVDALAPLRNQYLPPGAPLRSHLACVDVVRAVERADRRPGRVLAYSASMEDARIAVPLWELRATVDGRHGFASMLRDLPAVLAGDEPGVAPPGLDDYGDLGVGPDARIVDAVELAAGREDIWRWLVTDEHREAQRSWALARLPPLLGEHCPRSSRHIIGVLRAVTRLGPST